MMIFNQLRLSRQYTKIPSDAPHEHIDMEPSLNEHLRIKRRKIYGCVALTLAASFFALGFFAGMTTLQNRPRPFTLPNTVPRVPTTGWSRQSVRHNTSYEAAPPPSSAREEVWDALIPNGLGYVKHPDIAPNFSIIGVFHQLHCLYTVRRAYYSSPSSGQEDFDFGIDRPPHVAHCFDYLRQGIMCTAETSLEPAVERVNGNPGWGFERQCRDYQEIKTWAEEWRVFDAQGFVASSDHASFSSGGRGNSGKWSDSM